MKKALTRALATVLTLIAVAATAEATQDKSYLKGDGGAGLNCSDVASACTSFTTALVNTNSGGVIYCLNGVTDGSMFIDKSITIDCTDTNSSVIATTINPAVTINGAGIVVILRGLRIRGQGGGIGVNIVHAATVIIEDCTVSNFTVAPGVGIKFAPSSNAQLVVTDTSIANNGLIGTGGGIIVNPVAGGSALVMLDRVTVAENAFGIVADGSGSTAGIAMVVSNSGVHRNLQDGIVATTPGGGAPIGLTVKNTRSLSNNNGIRSTGVGGHGSSRPGDRHAQCNGFGRHQQRVAAFIRQQQHCGQRRQRRVLGLGCTTVTGKRPPRFGGRFHFKRDGFRLPVRREGARAALCPGWSSARPPTERL